MFLGLKQKQGPKVRGSQLLLMLAQYKFFINLSGSKRGRSLEILYRDLFKNA